MKCRNCGANVTEWMEYCPKCGSDPTRRTKPPKTPRNPPSKAIIAIVSAVLVAVVGAVIYYLLRPQPAIPQDNFGRKEGSHFTVRFEGGENAVTGHVVGILLEEAYYKIGSELGYYPQDKITAILYSKEAFMDVTRAPSWAGALFDGRIKIPSGGITEKTALLEKVLFHEYTHALVYGISKGRAPVWLNYKKGLKRHTEMLYCSEQNRGGKKIRCI